MRSMSLRDMQIPKSEKKFLAPPSQILGTPLVGYKLTPRKNKIDYTCKLCIQNIDKNTVSPPNDIQTGSYEPLDLSCSSKIVKNGETSIEANETNKK